MRLVLLVVLASLLFALVFPDTARRQALRARGLCAALLKDAEGASRNLRWIAGRLRRLPGQIERIRSSVLDTEKDHEQQWKLLGEEYRRPRRRHDVLKDPVKALKEAQEQKDAMWKEVQPFLDGSSRRR